MKWFKLLASGFGALSVGSASILVLDEKNIIDLTDYPVGRAARTGITLASIIVDYKYALFGLDKETNEYETAKSKAHARSAKKMFNLCWKNRGTYIKVGQHLGAMDYLLPPEYTTAFKVLHSNAPQSSLEEIEQVIKEDLKVNSLSDVFEEFSPKPLGTASLAQVHKATLKSGGSNVAVKVQHPRVRDLSDKDMNMMDNALEWVQYCFPEFDLMWLGIETRNNLPLELDFTVEARNCKQAKENLKCFDWVKIPKIYDNLSTSRVLVMEFMEGGQVNDMKFFKEQKIDFNNVSSMLGKLFSEMIFVQGFVHCDPHPGNILIRRRKSNSSWFSFKSELELVLLDHGLYRRLSEDFRYHYANLWQAIINKDLKGIEKHSRELGSGEMYPLLTTIVTGRAWKVVGDQGIKNVALTKEEDDEIRDNAGVFLPHISQVLNRVPSEMLLVLKANDHLRGLEHMYGVRGHLSGFLDMSRCCLRALRELKVNRTRKLESGISLQWSILEHTLTLYIGLFKLLAYEWYLWFQEVRKTKRKSSRQNHQVTETTDSTMTGNAFVLKVPG
uniref:AarF domain-containing protein kinase 1 n=1 Tax=Phallusia mammillata TaxID=59560 RepID=A0A6F9D5P3_9ASCI|nr:uncharacterized aarF domain-containing protein kinase 1-like [Phallusia mammillata]